MHAALQQHGSTIRAAITGLLDDLDVAQLLRHAAVPETDIAALKGRLITAPPETRRHARVAGAESRPAGWRRGT